MTPDVRETKKQLRKINLKLSDKTIPLSSVFEESIELAKSNKKYDDWYQLTLLFNGVSNGARSAFSEYLGYKTTQQSSIDQAQASAQNINSAVALKRGGGGKYYYPKKSLKEIEDLHKQSKLPEERDALNAILEKTRTYLSDFLQDILNQLEKDFPDNSKKIFIIHGHDDKARDELKSILSDEFKLEPIILSERENAGETIIEKLEREIDGCDYAISLMTPDDYVSNTNSTYYQPRPNVIFETGWFFGRRGRGKIIILSKKGERKLEIFSDISGLMRIDFEQNITEKKEEIQRELLRSGILTLPE
jgi:predicted nucleotide-binding protein